jgi:hypothetical protein
MSYLLLYPINYPANFIYAAECHFSARASHTTTRFSFVSSFYLLLLLLFFFSTRVFAAWPRFYFSYVTTSPAPRSRRTARGLGVNPFPYTLFYSYDVSVAHTFIILNVSDWYWRAKKKKKKNAFIVSIQSCVRLGLIPRTPRIDCWSAGVLESFYKERCCESGYEQCTCTQIISAYQKITSSKTNAEKKKKRKTRVRERGTFPNTYFIEFTYHHRTQCATCTVPELRFKWRGEEKKKELSIFLSASCIAIIYYFDDRCSARVFSRTR